MEEEEDDEKEDEEEEKPGGRTLLKSLFVENMAGLVDGRVGSVKVDHAPVVICLDHVVVSGVCVKRPGGWKLISFLF